MKNLFRNRYRIIKTSLKSYRVQFKKWYHFCYDDVYFHEWAETEEQALQIINAHKYCKYID